jgi:hypothetical protein
MVIEQKVEVANSNGDWSDEYKGDRPVDNSKYFSDAVPEGKMSFKTTFKFLTEGNKITNKFNKTVIQFQILHEGKEKQLEISTTNFDILKTISQAKPIKDKEVEWERVGSTQKDTRRGITFK